jgi:hyperosmotically inducible periplasmic protein
MSKKEKKQSTDKELQNKLYEAFHTAKEFKGYDINVTVRDGSANLQGIVDVLEETKKAVEFARDFPGINKVEDNLTISTDGAIDDDDVYMEVTQELGGDPHVDEEKIHFTVTKGVVTLLGEADSPGEREAAARAAAKARGVKKVNNQINLRQD